MLQKQQVLIDLLNNDNLPLNVQPFQDLNSTVFMKEINLIDFAYTISEIDLKFLVTGTLILTNPYCYILQLAMTLIEIFSIKESFNIQ